VWLEVDHFVRVYFSEAEKKESRLMAYICDFKRQLDYLFQLINNISVQNLTQVGKSHQIKSNQIKSNQI
jgi:hypothetical protein